MDWLKEHWDKILTIVVSGIVGFFSAITLVRGEIGQLKEQIHAVKETNLSDYNAANVQINKLQGLYELNVKDRLEIIQKDLALAATKSELDKVSDELSKAQTEYHVDNSIAEAYKVMQAALDKQVENERGVTLGEVRRIIEDWPINKTAQANGSTRVNP